MRVCASRFDSYSHDNKDPIRLSARDCNIDTPVDCDIQFNPRFNHNADRHEHCNRDQYLDAREDYQHPSGKSVDHKCA